jgi:hypothetical protein
MYSGTRLRVSTDNIGLARVREGLELVRIGQPQRPEFAAWRYGDQFGRRRRRHLIYSGLGIAAVAGIVVAGPATGFVAGGSWGLWHAANSLRHLYQARRIRLRLTPPGLDEPAILRARHLNDARLVSAPDAGTWQLHVAHERTDETRFWRGSLRPKTSPSFDAATPRSALGYRPGLRERPDTRRGPRSRSRARSTMSDAAAGTPSQAVSMHTW